MVLTMVIVCTWLFPTENGDNSGDSGGLAGHNSTHNRVVSGTEEMMMAYLCKMVSNSGANNLFGAIMGVGLRRALEKAFRALHQAFMCEFLLSFTTGFNLRCVCAYL